jgi:hypothetical protein
MKVRALSGRPLAGRPLAGWARDEGQRRMPGGSSRIFSPYSLFAGGELGGFWDPNDKESLFQDSAGTTAVTDDGHRVGLMRDKSGRGNHLSQATANSRATFHESAGLRWIETDGVDDFLGASYVQTAYPLTLMAGMLMTVSAGITGGILSVGSGTQNYMTFGDVSNTATFAAIERNTATKLTVSETVSTTVPYVALAEFRTDDFMAHQVNNNTPSADSTMSGQAFGTSTNIFLGKTRSTGLFTGHRFYGGLIINRLLSSKEKAQMKRWLARRMGISL